MSCLDPLSHRQRLPILAAHAHTIGTYWTLWAGVTSRSLRSGGPVAPSGATGATGATGADGQQGPAGPTATPSLRIVPLHTIGSVCLYMTMF